MISTIGKVIMGNDGETSALVGKRSEHHLLIGSGLVTMLSRVAILATCFVVTSYVTLATPASATPRVAIDKNESSKEITSRLGVEFDNGGELIVEQVDGLAQDGSDSYIQYFVRLASGALVELKNVPPDVQPGNFYDINGNWSMSSKNANSNAHPTVVVKSMLPVSSAIDDGSSTTGPKLSLAPPLTRNSLLVVIVDLADVNVPCTTPSVESMIWTGALNVRGQYEAASAGTFSFTGNSSGGNAIYRVKISSSSTGGCGSSQRATFRSRANTALAFQGILTSNYKHVLYVLPCISTPTACPGGIAAVGPCTNCYAMSFFCDIADIVVHELGHNLGYGHSGNDLDNNGSFDANSEYSDISSPMGASGYGWRHFGSVHKRFSSWIPADRIVTIDSGSGTYDLLSLESDPYITAGTTPQLLRVRIPASGTTPSYYELSLRRNQDPYSVNLSSSYLDRVSVHRQQSGGSAGMYSMSIKDIAVGQAFTDAGGTLVDYVSRTDNVAQVYVSVPSGDATPTPTPTSTPTATPTSTSTPTPTATPTSTPTPTPTATPTATPTTPLMTIRGAAVYFGLAFPPSWGPLMNLVQVQIQGLDAGGVTQIVPISSTGVFESSLPLGRYAVSVIRNPQAEPVFGVNSKTVTVPTSPTYARLTVKYSLTGVPGQPPTPRPPPGYATPIPGTAFAE